jgi:surfeit locus 1 family protein
MKPLTILFTAISIVLAALFVRLGFWQLERLGERRQHNELLRARLAAPPVPVESLRGHPDSLRYRRASLRAPADYGHEALVANRTRNGSPGVWLVTPALIPGSDTAILVARGWVYAPDGSSADRARWREGDSLTVEGWLDVLPPPAGTSDSIASRPGTVTRLDRGRMAARIGRPVWPLYLFATGDSAAQRADRAARFTLPELSDGPHRSYAIQWFSFAAIAVIGATMVILTDRRARHGLPHGGPHPAHNHAHTRAG